MTCVQTALALGGGGARGVAHLGVIEGLLEADFSIERIVGVSIGSLAGAMYAFDPDIHRVQEQALSFLLSPKFQCHQQNLSRAHPSTVNESMGGIFTWYDRVKDFLRANLVCHRAMRYPSLLPGFLLQEVVDHLLPDAGISESIIPMSIVSVDLLSGHKVVLEKGSLRDAVRASCSLPGIFPPVELDGMLLCDIGLFNLIPTTTTRSYGTNCLVAVDIRSRLKRLARCETVVDVLMRMNDVGENLFRKHVSAEADLIIRPDVSGVEWFDFSSSRQLLEAGRTAARKAIPELAATCCGS